MYKVGYDPGGQNLWAVAGVTAVSVVHVAALGLQAAEEGHCKEPECDWGAQAVGGAWRDVRLT
jgi:hypothetical protein